jgi:membrane protein YqaA with SNARE-associated domain
VTPDQRAWMFAEDSRHHARAAAMFAARAESASTATPQLVALAAEGGQARQDVAHAREEALAASRTARRWGLVALVAAGLAVIVDALRSFTG